MVVLRGKVLVLGSPSVGKSAILQMYGGTNVVFPKNYVMTPGVEMVTKKIPIPDTTDVVELFFLDVGGQDIYRDLFLQYIKKEVNLPFVMVVYDVTKRESFRAITQWLTLSNYNTDTSPPGILIANKIDLEERAFVKSDEGKALAIHQHLEYFEVSVKDNKGLDAPFLHLAKQLHTKYLDTVKEFEQS